jgi:hypothetical protein
MGEVLWLWVTRWPDFQHYPPERDRAPAWIKSYTKQLDDERYLDLTFAQRGVLDGIRLAFSRHRGRLPGVPSRLTQRLGGRVTYTQLEALNHAGFIELISRDELEKRLEAFYASRARAKKLEREKEEAGPVEKSKNGRRRTGYRMVHGTHGVSYVPDPEGTDPLPLRSP